MLKKTLCIFLCATILFMLSSCGENQTANKKKAAPEASGEFSVEILNLGKADAIILTTSDHTVIIDSGNRGDGKKILECLEEKGISSIDSLIITHFDKDHVGGAVKLINNLEIGEIIAPKYKGNTDEYTRYIKCLSENGKKQTVLTSETSFVLDDVLFEVYPALKNSYKESDNDFSIVVSVTHGDNKFLFAGDAESERLAELSSQMDLKHTFLKVPHHGKMSAGSEEFIKAVSPDYAVITESSEEPADPEIKDILKNTGTEVYSSINGNIKAVSDGHMIEIKQ